MDNAADDEDEGAGSSSGEDEAGLEPAASAASMEACGLPLLALVIDEVCLTQSHYCIQKKHRQNDIGEVEAQRMHAQGKRAREAEA